MKLEFTKYSASGNDFIIIDNRQESWNYKASSMWEKLCARKIGIGADGILFLENHDSYDFACKYLNSDGQPADMCGNGARAICHYFTKNIRDAFAENLKFNVWKNTYHARVEGDKVSLVLGNIKDFERYKIPPQVPLGTPFFVNTGVPHLVIEVRKEFFVNREKRDLAMKFRNHPMLGDDGANVSFMHFKKNDLAYAETYERGVEDFTLSCGTGIAAIGLYAHKKLQIKELTVQTGGGAQEVNLENAPNEITVTGNVDLIYLGETVI